ncbi:MAG TPA: glycerophosphodiester phosphodiesterase [Polyangiaceae bacterium]|nr:glycerophosphodiester phosphodiesterase [Polyangiaceae bacterium]
MSVASQYPALSGPLPLTFAHRGGAALWPENTLEAFRGAIELGCTHIETDLRMTRDGEIVVMHDDVLDRTTSGSGRVSTHTLSQLRRLDAGYHFSPDGKSFPRRGQGLVIPTLAEVVALSGSVRFNVEIKERGPFDLPRALLAFIERYGIADRIVVAAERHDLMRQFRRLSQGRIATSASRRECLQFWFASRLSLTAFLRLPYRALQIPVRAGNLTVVTRQFLDAAHREGLAVHVWTIDERTEMLRLLDLGVDGLMSDRPDRLRQVVLERAQPAGTAGSAPPTDSDALKQAGETTPVNHPG